MSSDTLYDDKLLLKQLAQSDEKAFENLYRAYADRIYGVAYAYTKSASFSEEIVQDVFLKVWLKRNELDHVDSFENYIFIAARNHVLNKLKSIARERESFKKLAHFFENNTRTPEQELAFKESNHLIETAISQLPQQQQLVYKLAKHQGLSRQEIAAQLKISENTVKNHMGKAIQFVRAYVKHNSGDIICLLALLLLEL